MVDKIQSEKIQGLVLSLIFNRARIHPEPRKRSLNIIQLNSPFFYVTMFTPQLQHPVNSYFEKGCGKKCARENPER